MGSGLIKYNWEFINNYSDEEVTYFLSLEGKSIEAISKIRNLDSSTVQKHIINCKIKYRFLAKSNNMPELFKVLLSCPKDERIFVINGLDRVNKAKLMNYIKTSYMDMELKEKEGAIWIMGEMRENIFVDILIKASVNNHVNIRRMAISALGKIGDLRGEAALIRGLSDENLQVVAYAIKSLQKLKSISAKEKIEQLLYTSKKEYVKKACEDYLTYIESIL